MERREQYRVVPDEPEGGRGERSRPLGIVNLAPGRWPQGQESGRTIANQGAQRPSSLESSGPFGYNRVFSCDK